jgi:hypothetical protein
MPTRPRTPRRDLAAAIGAALLLAACNPPAPSAVATPSTPPATAAPGSPTPGASQASAQVYASIRQSVEAIRGLRPTADVGPVTIDAQQLRTNLQTEFDKENPAHELRFSEDALGLLGLLPSGSSLRDLTLDFQAGQVAGYYSPDRKELFVVSRSGGVGPAEEVTYAHEFTHQLTDQRFDLARLGVDAANQSDRALAQLALIEGDAVSVQTTWTVQNLTPEEMGQLLQSALDPEALAALQRAPAYLRETALFPYQDGLTFVSGLLASGGYDAVNAAYAKPPDSTEQVLHPEKYTRREAPRVVKIPKLFEPGLPAGWKALGEDTLGEFILRLWLTQGGVIPEQASTAAAGWGGDRLELYDSPNGTSLLLVTEWDTLGDASEFAAAAKAALPKLGLRGDVAFDERSPSVFIAVGDDAGAITPRVFG